jgi:hypothetical protein
MKHGLHLDIPAADYHDDCCATPSLSASVGKILIEKSPRHAWLAHPRLGGARRWEKNRSMELGSLAHETLLSRGAGIVEIDAGDYRTKAAQAARDEALASGLTPSLPRDFRRVAAMRAAMMTGLERAGLLESFVASPKEAVAIAEIDGVLTRGMLDVWIPELAMICDYKTCSSLTPNSLGRLIVSSGYDLQAAVYLELIEEIFPDLAGRTDFVFFFQETAEPYECIFCRLDARFREIGVRKAAKAREIWTHCLARGDWPGYATEITTIDCPAWAQTYWETE